MQHHLGEKSSTTLGPACWKKTASSWAWSWELDVPLDFYGYLGSHGISEKRSPLLDRQLLKGNCLCYLWYSVVFSVLKKALKAIRCVTVHNNYRRISGKYLYLRSNRLEELEGIYIADIGLQRGSYNKYQEMNNQSSIQWVLYKVRQVSKSLEFDRRLPVLPYHSSRLMDCRLLLDAAYLGFQPRLLKISNVLIKQ